MRSYCNNKEELIFEIFLNEDLPVLATFCFKFNLIIKKKLAHLSLINHYAFHKAVPRSRLDLISEAYLP
jgi:hypothetical protein